MQRPGISWLPLLCLLCLAGAATAQEETAEPTPELEIPVDEYDRGTPLRSSAGYLAAAEKGDYETAAEYLDLRNLRGEASELAGPQLARRFHVVARRANWIEVDELVDDPAGRRNDNLPGYRDSIGIVLDEGKEVRLLMQKVPRGDGVFIWKISNATVSVIPELYEEYGYPEVVEDIRRGLPARNILGFELFKWVIILCVAAITYLVVFLVALVIRRTMGDPGRVSHRRVFRFLIIPFGIWLTILAINTTATWLGRGAAAEKLQQYTPVPIIITIWVLYAAINLSVDIFSRRFEKAGKPAAVMLLEPAANAIKLLVVIGAVLVYLDKLGVNITTVLAGLGVGGLAVALALQKPLEDVFGAITLYTQQPIRVGDFCKIGSTLGTIESIGLRTTRVRTLQNTVIAAPNSKFAAEAIDNISARERILYWPTLRLRYDTTPEQVKAVLSGIRELLTSHERICQDNHRVRFKEIGKDALLIEIYAHFETRVWAEYLELVEQLNLQILKIVSASGTSLGLPAQSLRIEGETN